MLIFGQYNEHFEIFQKEIARKLDDERFGNKPSGTTGLSGLGINAKKKEQQLDEALLDYLQTRERNMEKIAALEAEKRNLLALRQQEFEKYQPHGGREGISRKFCHL